MLSGISTEYYLRLEQGRERRPSERVLGSLARALQLNGDAAQYICDLARPESQRRQIPSQHVEPILQSMIDRWSLTPAYVQGSMLSVIAANPLARALTPFFSRGVNLPRATFLEPEMRQIIQNWETITAAQVAWLRFFLGAEGTADPELLDIVDELCSASARFRTLWSRHEVKQKTTGTIVFCHPQVGRLSLIYRTLTVPETGQVLVAHDAEAGTCSEERLHRLARLTNQRTCDVARPPPMTAR
ncbi:transcriptional regulator with XRE-family HTH domain [Mycobacterium sp. AZCC_0083]|nr:transcriptional regulator with XRE-family HTH domain [Mycobacterium sp. AZCC_0083]